jgi:hypothetical protein
MGFRELAKRRAVPQGSRWGEAAMGKPLAVSKPRSKKNIKK